MRIAQADGRNRVWLVVAAGVLMFACAPLFVPVSPTLDPNSVNTAIAETANAASTRTALLTPPTWTPTFTPFPSGTAPSTPTATETFMFALPTFTRTKTFTPIPFPTEAGGAGDAKFSCSVTSVNPSNGAVFSPNQAFQARWIIRNTGTSRWERPSMDYVFAGGDALHQQDGYDLNQNVKPGASTEIVVDMRAPSSPGNYSTTWRLKDGTTQFCNMQLGIVVQ